MCFTWSFAAATCNAVCPSSSCSSTSIPPPRFLQPVSICSTALRSPRSQARNSSWVLAEEDIFPKCVSDVRFECTSEFKVPLATAHYKWEKVDMATSNEKVSVLCTEASMVNRLSLLLLFSIRFLTWPRYKLFCRSGQLEKANPWMLPKWLRRKKRIGVAYFSQHSSHVCECGVNFFSCQKL